MPNVLLVTENKIKESINVSHNALKTEGLDDFFKNVGRSFAKAGKGLATNAVKRPGRAMKNGTNVGRVIISNHLKAAKSTIPKVLKLCNTVRVIYLGKIV